MLYNIELISESLFVIKELDLRGQLISDPPDPDL
jgi:hypothetical protein